MLETLSVQRLK
jgi:hypothetical protein